MNNSISENNMTNNYDGILIMSSSNNTVFSNTFVGNTFGIKLQSSSNNTIFHNNFINNTNQAACLSSSNSLDDGSSKGNYWSDYLERYPNATEIDGTDIWDTPYVIDENNVDHYPIVPESPSFLILPLFMMATLLAIIMYRKNSKVCQS